MAKPQHTVILLVHFTSQSGNVYIRYEINTHLYACVYIFYMYIFPYMYTVIAVVCFFSGTFD